MKTLQSFGSDGAGPNQQVINEMGPWFHNIHLPDGSQTAPDHPLGDFPQMLWEPLSQALPQDLRGWTALDIGCNAGFYTFKLAERGAQVLGVDSDVHYLRQARWAAEQLEFDQQVRFKQMQVYELASSAQSFDLVLFMGVFYHLRYPLLAFDAISRLAQRMLVFQSLTIPGEEIREDTHGLSIHERGQLQEPGWPKLAFLEHEMAGDPTNWWVPNQALNQALIRQAGFEITARPAEEIYLCRPGPDRRQKQEQNEEEFKIATRCGWR